MKIHYILKKGFHCYPPCLAQVLYLNDMGVDIEVYHGAESEVIVQIFNERHITHHTLVSDRTNSNSFQSAVTMLAYKKEIAKIVSAIPKDDLIWYGNCESAMALGVKILSHQFVLSVLELYDQGSLYDRFLKKYINHATLILCCEKHRAQIMKAYYSLKQDPFVLPNKPYELVDNLDADALSAEVKEKISGLKDKFIVLYQGIVTPDRPLDKVALALSDINNEQIVFVVMGRATEDMKNKIRGCYTNTVFMDYVPSPQHLLVTKYANIGIANYDYSNLNNLFCAPNKIYEYAKFGVPMLVSKNIGLTETVGNYGAAECVDFDNVNCIKNGIQKIFSSNQEYSQKALAFYEKTDNSLVMQEIMNVLEDH